MEGRIPGNSCKPGLLTQLFIAELVMLGVLSAIWMGGCFRHTQAPHLPFWSVSFSPDSASVVTGGAGVRIPPPSHYIPHKGPLCPGELVFWKISSKRERALQEPNGIRSVAWSPDGKFIAVGDYVGVTRLVDAKTGQTLLGFSPPARQVSAVAISGNSQLVAASTLDGTIELWDALGKEQNVFFVPPEKFLDVAISRDGEALVATGRSGKAYLYNLADLGDPLKLQAYDGPPPIDPTAECAAFSADGLAFATGSLKNLRIWETRTGTLQQDLACTADVNNVAFAPKGDIVATVHADGRLALWNFHTGAQLNSTQAHPDEAFGLSFSPDGKRIATVSRNDFTIKIWDAATLQLVAAHHRSNST
jgi:WD40 repeat protein